jgi:hypothetical protein
MCYAFIYTNLKIGGSLLETKININGNPKNNLKISFDTIENQMVRVEYDNLVAKNINTSIIEE